MVTEKIKNASAFKSEILLNLTKIIRFSKNCVMYEINVKANATPINPKALPNNKVKDIVLIEPIIETYMRFL